MGENSVGLIIQSSSQVEFAPHHYPRSSSTSSSCSRHPNLTSEPYHRLQWPCCHQLDLAFLNHTTPQASPSFAPMASSFPPSWPHRHVCAFQPSWRFCKKKSPYLFHNQLACHWHVDPQWCRPNKLMLLGERSNLYKRLRRTLPLKMASSSQAK